jgi:rhodanese-related sulfurtransferase
MPFWGQGDPPPPFWGHEPVPKIDAKTAAAAVDAGALLLDVGYPANWLDAHLPHAVMVEPELFDRELERLPKDAKLVVAARDDGLAEMLVGAARERGFDAAVLIGGQASWHAAGRPLVRGDGTRIP